MYLFPHPPLAFYILRGWLGVWAAFGLWRGWRIPGPAFVVVALWEGSSAVCGSMYAGLLPAGVIKPLCDKGTGLPLMWPALAVTLLVCGHLLSKKGE